VQNFVLCVCGLNDVSYRDCIESESFNGDISWLKAASNMEDMGN
jgi:hypothetical protein